MKDTPDLSSIVNLIMQNPTLIEQISSLAKSKSESEESVDVSDAKTEPAAVQDELVAEASSAPLMRSHRHELLSAMKPYLSENRRAAIDSMASILDVIDVMVRK